MSTWRNSKSVGKRPVSNYDSLKPLTDTHHMVIELFLLLGLAAEYRSRSRRRWCDKHCGRPSDVDNTDRWSKLTALETISCWLLLKKRALRGNVRTPSMARWKARGRLYICCNWTLSAISYGWDVMSGNRSKLAFFDGGWVTLSADFIGKGASPTNHCWRQKTRVIAVSCGIKIFAVRCLVLSHYMHLTDGRTDRRTDRQTDRIATAIPCVGLHAVAR